MTVRVGFLGCGLIAGFHALGLARVDEAEIVAAHDPDGARAQQFADAQGARVVGSVDEVLAACDAVFVTSWTAAHPELVDAVVGAGLPVFCEKPLGVDLTSARRMQETVETAGVINQVGLVLRSSPAFRWLQHEIATGRHGPPMSMVFRDDQYLPTKGMYASTWRGDPDLAGSGALLEHSIHDLDLIEWILGPLDTVMAATAHHHGIDGIEDQASLLLEAENGAHALLSSTWHDIESRPSQRLVEVFCRDGHLRVDGDWHGPVRLEISGAEPVELSGRELSRGSNPDADFIAAVRDGRSASPDFAVAVRAHEICDAAYRSAAAGQRMDVRPEWEEGGP